MKNNKFKKVFLYKNREILFSGIILISFVIFVLSYLYFLNLSDKKTTDITSLSVIIPSKTIALTPSPTIFIPTPIPFTPTPTTPTYKYTLNRSHNEVRMQPSATTGFSVAVTPIDDKGNVVTDQSGFQYNWSVDDKSLLVDGAGTFSACTQGIQPPCPNDHYSFTAQKSGSTIIRVNVVKDGTIVGATTIPLIVE